MIKEYCGSLYGCYRQNSFVEVFPSVESFINDYKTLKIPQTISEESATILYYLLYGKYGNSTIAASDSNRFKYRLFSLVFEFAPAWEKRLELQQAFRDLTNGELIDGGSAIYNSAQNPSTEPTTETGDELPFLNAQNVTKYKKSQIEAIASQWDEVVDDVTEKFLTKFQKLFIQFVSPELPLWYFVKKDEADEEKEDLT